MLAPQFLCQIRRLPGAIVIVLGCLLSLCLGVVLGPSIGRAQPDPLLAAIIGGPQRSEANKARDQYRHPLEVLSFFGLKVDSNPT